MFRRFQFDRVIEGEKVILRALNEKLQLKKNNQPAKIKRTLTSILPVDKNRTGQCKHCSACCKLPNRCPFLETDEHNKSVCKIYSVRPPACRKYPRSPSEHITTDSCGFSF
jgi:hypothetical protein